MRLPRLALVCALDRRRCLFCGRANAASRRPAAVSVMLPNYNTVPVGELASLEAGAFVARANDTSSAFHNPAGLTRAERTSISGNAGVFQFGSVSPEGLDVLGSVVPADSRHVCVRAQRSARQRTSGPAACRWHASTPGMQGVDSERTLAAGSLSEPRVLLERDRAAAAGWSTSAWATRTATGSASAVRSTFN